MVKHKNGEQEYKISVSYGGGKDIKPMQCVFLTFVLSIYIYKSCRRTACSTASDLCQA